MNILVFSDSHGRSENINEVMRKQIKKPDAVIFLGDGLRDLDYCDFEGTPLFKVRGNCDYFALMGGTDVTDDLIITLGDKRIMMTHGHNYGVKSTLTPLMNVAVKNNVDILLFGHTHEGFEMTLTPENDQYGLNLSKPLYILNPGSIGSYSATFGSISIDRRGGVLLSHGRL